jgi:nitrogen fixation protein NifB
VGLLGEDRSQEFTKDKFLAMTPEYNLQQRQEVHAGIEKFKEELKAAKEKTQPTNVETSPVTSLHQNPKILVAVATKGGGLVNQHFGHAKEFQIYEVDGHEAHFIGHRKIDHYCQGGYGENATLEHIIQAIADCKAVLVSKIGECPKEKLHKAGIQTVETYDVIEKVALEFYEQFIQE